MIGALLACVAVPEGLDESAATEDSVAEPGGFIAVSEISLEPGRRRVVVLDAEGAELWSWESPDQLAMPIQVRFARDGSGVWVFEQVFTESIVLGRFRLVRVGWSGLVEQVVEGLGHTGFALLGEDRVAVLRKVQEVDGDQTWIVDEVVLYEGGEEIGPAWRVSDDLAVSLWGADAVQGPGDPNWDVFHANWVAPSPSLGAVLVSLGAMDAVVEVDLEQGLVGGVDRRGLLGGAGSDALVELPHSIVADGPDWLVFNRRQLEDPALCSEAVRLRGGPSGVERVWSWASPDCIKTTFLGAALALGGERTLLSFGSGGALYVLGADDEVLLERPLGLGLAYGQPDWTESVSGL
jgi:hypothetical protein